MNQVVLTGNMKTAENWKGSLEDYLEIGDYVDEEIYNHFINVMPPACFRTHLVQIGEPYSHVDGKPTFATLQRIDGEWVYVGNCFRGDNENQKGNWY